MNNFITQFNVKNAKLEDLLSFDDRTFLNSAYQLLLGRQPDLSGKNYYLSLIAKGVDRLEIIARIRCSDESAKWADFINTVDDNKYIILYRKNKNRSFFKLKILLNNFLKKNISKNTTSEIRTILRDHQDQTRLQIAELSLSIEKLITQRDKLQDIRKLKKSIKFSELILHKNQRYVFNLSSSKHWQSPVVGIIRVERELAARMCIYKNVIFIYWSDEGFKTLTTKQVENILDDDWLDPNSKRKFSQTFKEKNAAFVFADNDVYISIGLDWDLTPLNLSAKELGKANVSCVFGCHDIVPILFPEYTARKELTQIFKQHIIDITHCANVIWVNSESTKDTLSVFLEDCDLNVSLPTIIPVGLASSLNYSDTFTRLGDCEDDIYEEIKQKGPFVLYVSSLESRKNHRLLINIWRDLYKERGQECPQLVLVGMAGWGTNDLKNQISRMPATIAGKILVITGASDFTLRQLYASCEFTVFPSIFEGWGLAANEAMMFGKICIVANAGALVESTQNIMPSFHPCDFPSWKSEIEKIIDDVDYKTSLEEKIVKHYKRKTWDEFANEFCNLVLHPSNFTKKINNTLKEISILK